MFLSPTWVQWTTNDEGIEVRISHVIRTLEFEGGEGHHRFETACGMSAKAYRVWFGDPPEGMDVSPCETCAMALGEAFVRGMATTFNWNEEEVTEMIEKVKAEHYG